MLMVLLAFFKGTTEEYGYGYNMATFMALWLG